MGRADKAEDMLESASNESEGGFTCPIHAYNDNVLRAFVLNDFADEVSHELCILDVA